MGSNCCCCGETDKPKKKSKSKDKTGEKSNNVSDDKKPKTDERLSEEQRNSFKGGSSGYSAHLKKKLRLKSLSKSQYNTKGLVDERSEEFQIVKTYMDGKDYDLMTSIGSGNYAEVYKAMGRTREKKFVAVKVIDLRKVKENYRTNLLQNEIAVLQICKHPNIIKMYDISQTKNRIFMIMEFAPNGTLADWLRDKGAFVEARAHLVFPPVLSAIDNMHSHRIAHRDLKLENILLTQNFDPKISDFSYAIKHRPNDPKNTQYCGSLPYFSPELLMRQPYDPLISDVWSLGICFYIMLNDGLPFKLGNDKLMLKNQLTKNWKFRPKIDPKLSEELKSMVRKMLEPDVELRITAAQLMKEKWITDN